MDGLDWFLYSGFYRTYTGIWLGLDSYLEALKNSFSSLFSSLAITSLPLKDWIPNFLDGCQWIFLIPKGHSYKTVMGLACGLCFPQDSINGYDKSTKAGTCLGRNPLAVNLSWKLSESSMEISFLRLHSTVRSLHPIFLPTSFWSILNQSYVP